MTKKAKVECVRGSQATFAIVICTLLLPLSFPKEIPLYLCLCHFQRKSKSPLVIIFIKKRKSLTTNNLAFSSSNHQILKSSNHYTSFILKNILFRAKSTSVIFTVTCCVSFTISLGSLIKRFAICEI